MKASFKLSVTIARQFHAVNVVAWCMHKFSVFLLCFCILFWWHFIIKVQRSIFFVFPAAKRTEKKETIFFCFLYKATAYRHISYLVKEKWKDIIFHIHRSRQAHIYLPTNPSQRVEWTEKIHGALMIIITIIYTLISNIAFACTKLQTERTLKQNQ